MRNLPWLPLLALLGGLAACQATPPRLTVPEGANPVRWQPAVQQFEADDQANPPPKHATLFLGSSSIRLWDSLTTDMAPLPVVQRGFGGSKLFDAVYYTERLVAAHEPAVVVVFSGTNDIASPQPKSATEVRDLFLELVARVRWFQPDVPICYIAISPTPARQQHMDIVLAANRLIATECQKGDRLTFIDTASELLDRDGQPDPRWFVKDQLHLNAQGYAAWTRRIRPVVTRVYRSATAETDQPTR